MSGHRDPPEWWPHGEAWPPRGPGRRHGGGSPGPWRHGPGRKAGRWRPFGCLVLLLGLFAAGAIFMALWALAAIAGVVEASPVVVGAGIAAFAVVLVGGLAVAWALRQMTAPLDDLVEASQRIEAGDYSARVPVSGRGGVRSLTRAFNQMSTELQASDERRRSFLADVTHELRTPLTVISGQLEAIEDGVYSVDATRIAALLAQTRQMAALVEDLHTLSLADAGALRLRPVPSDLNDVADEAVVGFTPSAQIQGVDLRIDVTTAPVVAMLDVAATRRVLGNVLSNAIRHTAKGGTIDVAVRGTPEGSRIDIVDDGGGMSPEVLAHALERFAKGEDSTGSGLGLAIAHDLMAAQGGSIEVRSSVGVGTHVTIGFPASGL